MIDYERCQSIQPRIEGGARCVGSTVHTGHHMSSFDLVRQEWGHDTIHDCRDCGAKPGRPHDSGCDMERCSVCGEQWIGCGCEGHDPIFARWTGLYPGSAEARALGMDLNEFHARGLNRIFFVKPLPDR